MHTDQRYLTLKSVNHFGRIMKDADYQVLNPGEIKKYV